jgi:hypothetical protein
MSKQTINIGASPNDGTGTPLRTSFDYTNQNFTELYTALGGGVGLPGATTQVIFNDGGTNLAGDAGLVYNKTTDALTVAGLVTAGSATITGDLTVRTNKLLVTSTGVGVGMTPITPLSGVIGTTGAVFFRTTDPAAPVASPYIQAPVSTGFSSTAAVYSFWYQDCGISNPAVGAVGVVSGSSERYRIAADGVATWSNVGGVAGTAMTLNATGLNVGGGSPTAKISCAGYSSANQLADINIVRSSSGTTIQTGPNIVFTDGTSINTVTIQNSQGRFGIWNYGASAWNERLSVDSSGNVGVGVTPSAWNSDYKPIDIGLNGCIAGRVGASNTLDIAANSFRNSAGDWVYKQAASTPAVRYQLDGSSGSHIWFSGVAGTAGNTIAGFTTAAMTLNSTGNLVFPSAKGIDFSATADGSGTRTSELLNDYEEGTFTPTVRGSTVAGTGVYTTQAGFYTKVGRIVTVTVYLNWTAVTLGTGNLQFAGLPFTSLSSPVAYSGISIAFASNIATTAGTVLYGSVEPGAAVITMTQTPTGGGAYGLVPLDTSGEISFSATYTAA